MRKKILALAATAIALLGIASMKSVGGVGGGPAALTISDFGSYTADVSSGNSVGYVDGVIYSAADDGYIGTVGWEFQTGAGSTVTSYLFIQVDCYDYTSETWSTVFVSDAITVSNLANTSGAYYVDVFLDTSTAWPDAYQVQAFMYGGYAPNSHLENQNYCNGFPAAWGCNDDDPPPDPEPAPPSNPINGPIIYPTLPPSGPLGPG